MSEPTVSGEEGSLKRVEYTCDLCHQSKPCKRYGLSLVQRKSKVRESVRRTWHGGIDICDSCIESVPTDRRRGAA